ncbi:UNVERIFIED_ORG: hypothetical protein JN05_00991 [Zoogloea ramigera]|uniref:Uncharacterized protein n=1 Tax=Duganella zoogloeoides TaxID=75659 RepID=A0ABZ0Y3I2_9BURK|nr:hypothetical protein [Duganella zoogloeoides]WQH06599.1 hypothetical protein SR858_09835 [Duganella zoogloeoides]
MPNGQIALARKPDYLDCATVELASLVEALRIAITGKSWRDVLCMLQNKKLSLAKHLAYWKHFAIMVRQGYARQADASAGISAS